MEKSNIWLIDKEKMLVCVHLLYEHYLVVLKPLEYIFGDTKIQNYTILYYDESCLHDEGEEIMKVERTYKSLDECLEYLKNEVNGYEDEMWEIDYVDKNIIPYLKHEWLKK